MALLDSAPGGEGRRPVGPGTRARRALALNAVVATVALVVKVVDAATTADPRFPTVLGRLANELCYFTIQSNVIVAVVAALLALEPVRWRPFAGGPRLTGLVCITITAIVYYTLLAGDEHFHGIALVGDVLAHAVSPLLFVGTFVVLGPRGALRWGHVAQLLAFPLAWVALTLARGAIIHFYPYDFVDVDTNGYVSVLVTIAGLTAGAVLMAAGAVAFDRRVSRRRPARAA